MVIVVVVMSILIILLATYIVYFQLQLRNTSRQLVKRLDEHTRQPISLELINSEFNALVVNINKCLKLEENQRIDGIREEKRFKEMIANISHDLRTPLTAIMGYLELMETGELTEDQHKKLRIARKNAKELGKLIEHFFEYSYALNAEPKLKLERINLTNLVTECLVAAIPTLEENNLIIKFEQPLSIFVLADREMVIRIIQNLIRNCVQHGYGYIKVELLVEEKAVVSFKNPIKSNSEIDVERIFDRFYTRDKSGRNNGLGLSIIRLFAEQLGGSVGASLQNGVLDIRVSVPSAYNS